MLGAVVLMLGGLCARGSSVDSFLVLVELLFFCFPSVEVRRAGMLSSFCIGTLTGALLAKLLAGAFVRFRGLNRREVKARKDLLLFCLIGIPSAPF